jgi:hypothetical protein
VRATRIASAPASASRPIRPTIGSSLAVLGRLPDVPTGRALSDADGGGTLGVVVGAGGGGSGAVVGCGCGCAGAGTEGGSGVVVGWAGGGVVGAGG